MCSWLPHPYLHWPFPSYLRCIDYQHCRELSENHQRIIRELSENYQRIIRELSERTIAPWTVIFIHWNNLNLSWFSLCHFFYLIPALSCMIYMLFILLQFCFKLLCPMYNVHKIDFNLFSIWLFLARILPRLGCEELWVSTTY